ncbi:ATP-grasp domain-containing protein [Cognatishimia sp. MH4019]|uniref:ATP-grasp domain-containing protein n=1 Tax=Cognatishimia sp. MH4019 TaxID=2854030 RepID=UPI001CD38898|nr:ATP-grasp domain-containing protein [Cognatishimia sp. MH4019]
MTKSNFSVLICSAGRRHALLESFRAALATLELPGRVIACDLDPHHSAACASADAAYPVPRATEPGYADAILEIAQKENVALVIPTIDPELLPLAEARDRFANAGVRVHVSDPDTIAIVRDKEETSRVLQAAGVPVPATFAEAEIRSNAEAVPWPLFAKPSGGSASRGLAVLSSPGDVPDKYPEPMIYQELLTGPEYTINMFVDQDGDLKTVVPHRRLSVRAGEVEKGCTERRADLHQIAENIVRALPGLCGVACFQVIDDPKLGVRAFEINARFGGGFPLADYAGAHFAQWLLEEVSDKPRTASNDWRDGAEMLRYDAAVFRG